MTLEIFENQADAAARARSLSETYARICPGGFGVFNDRGEYRVEPVKFSLGVCVAFFKAGAEFDPFTKQEKAMNTASAKGWAWPRPHAFGLAMTHPEESAILIIAEDGTETLWS